MPTPRFIATCILAVSLTGLVSGCGSEGGGVEVEKNTGEETEKMYSDPQYLEQNIPVVE